RGYYFMFNTSLYQSKYTALDGIERNTRFNVEYLVNALAGKEFAGLGKKKNRLFSINLKAHFGGGRYIVPLLRDENGDLAVDVEQGLIFEYSKAYESKLDDLVNVVLSVSHKWNLQRTTHELYLNIDNLTNSQARMREFYNVNEPGGVAYERQVGIIPNFLYRIYF
ncbi:MAG: TonB-dependent receptor, partial [Phaeodactylibacter sp.]|nr:TonB-dependent receptor [Phaeodactylibacter sp.]